MSRVVSLRLKDDQMERLERAARRWGRTPSEVAAALLEEALRLRDFAFIEFRDSPIGRQAYLQGTRLAVWQVVWLARTFDGEASRVAEHLEMPLVRIKAALTYSAAYPSEIDLAISDNAEAAGRLPQLLPQLEIVDVGAHPS